MVEIDPTRSQRDKHVKKTRVASTQPEQVNLRVKMVGLYALDAVQPRPNT